MASLILGSIGTTLGGPVGGFIGSAIGGLIDAYLFTPSPPDVQGPRLDDTSTASADPGVPIAWVFGADRVAATVIQNSDLIETITTVEKKSGKKSYKETTYTYSITAAFMFSEGPILGIGRIWADGNLIRGPRGDFVGDTQTYRYNVGGFPYPSWYRIADRMYDPQSPQLPWSLDPALGNENGGRYSINVSGSMIYRGDVVTNAESLQERVDAGELLYWYDLDDNQYYPVGAQVAYDPTGAIVGPDGQVYTGGDVPPDPNGVDGGYYEFERGYYESYTTEDGLGGVFSFYEPTGESMLGNTFASLYGCVGWNIGGPASNPYPIPSTEIQNYYGTGEEPVTDETPPRLTYTQVKNQGVAAFPASIDNTAVVNVTGLDAINQPVGFDYIDNGGFTNTGFVYTVNANCSGYFNNPDNEKTEVYTVYGTSTVNLATVDLPNTSPNAGFKTWTNQEVLDQSDLGNLVIGLSFYAALYDDFQDDGAISMSYLCHFDVFRNGGWENLFTRSGTLSDVGQGTGDKYARERREFGWYRLPAGTTKWRTRNAITSAPEDYYDPSPTGGGGGRKGGADAGKFRGATVGFSVSGMSAAPPLNDGGGVFRGWNDYYNLHAALNDFSPLAVLGFQNPDNLVFYRGTDDQPADPTLVALRDGGVVPGYRCRAYIMMDNLQLEDYGNRLPSLSFEVVRYENETIVSTIESIFLRAGVPVDMYDVAALPTSGVNSFLPGYSVSTRTSARKAMEQAINAYRIDVAEVGTELLFRRRARSADHIINYTDLRARPTDSANNEPLLKITTKDQRELPRTSEVIYKDIERDYQTNSARHQRTQTPNDHLGSTSTALVVYPYFAKIWAREALRDAWIGKGVEFTLPYEYIKVSPTDIVTIVTDTVIGTENGIDVVANFAIKITQVRIGRNNVIDLEGVVTGAAFYDVDDAFYDTVENENNYIITADNNTLGVTRFEMLDISPLGESDLLYGFYYAMSDINFIGWSGASLLQSLDGGTNYDPIATAGTAAVIGTVTTGILPTIDCNGIEQTGNIIVTVDTAKSSIASVTIEDMLVSLANRALIGGEVVCFTDVAYLGSRQYQLTGSWIRGLNGTEGTEHFANERFVLLDGAIGDYAASAARIGQELLYKPVSTGVSDALTPSTAKTHTGKRLKPLSPVMVTGVRDGGNDLTISWTRRDRVYSSWLDNVDLPNSETSLAFEVDIIDNGLVIRTISVAAATAAYSAADQTTDGLTPGDPVTVRVYQISDAVGRGTEAEEIV